MKDRGKPFCLHISQFESTWFNKIYLEIVGFWLNFYYLCNNIKM